MNLTRQAIKQAVDEAQATIRLWNASDAPNENWRGATVKAMSEAVLQHLDRLAALSGLSDEIDPDARGIVLAIDRLTAELYKWAESLELSPESAHPAGSTPLWQAWKTVADAAQDQPRRLPEPIGDLINQEVPLQQIAKQYGFLHEDGTPDMRKVVEEREKPGTHYDPETWVHPADRRRQREVDALWAQRKPEARPRLVSEPRQPRIAPESLDDLIAQDVPPEQIAKMKQISVEEVLDRAAQIGIPIGGKFRRPLDPQERDKVNQELAQKQTDIYASSHPETADMTQRILECHIDGMKPVDIAAALQVDHPTLSWQKVAAVIKQAEKDPAAAAS